MGAGIIPFSGPLEEAIIPDKKRVIEAVRRAMEA
jgi:hypothetical protein